MEKLKSALNNYHPILESEVSFKDSMIELLNTKKESSFYRSNINAHFTASAWILNKNMSATLLLKHSKLNKWLQAGGHADGETDLIKVAEKEAKEETGLKKLRLLQESIFDLDIHHIPSRENILGHLHYDVRYLFTCDNEDEVKINHESKAFKWVKLEDLHKLTDNESILRMADKSLKL